MRNEIREAVREEVTRLLSGTSPSTSTSEETRRQCDDKNRSSSRSSIPCTSQSSSTLTFEDFYKMRESQRQLGCKPQKKRKKSPSTSAPKKSTNVEIKVGMASQSDGTIKTRRGKTHVITVNSSASKEEIVQKAVEKHSSFDQSFDDTVAYVLLYPDYREVHCIPGTTKPFVLSEYKQAISKDYKRLTFYLIPLDDVVDNSDESDQESRKSTPVPADIRKYVFNPIPPVTTINIDDQDALSKESAGEVFIQYWYSCMTDMFSFEDISNFPILNVNCQN
jgi:hypothetical protein